MSTTNRIFVGSTKDIMDLRKTVEFQTLQIQSQKEEIQKLKDTIHNHQEKYRYLLESNDKFWTHLNKVEKQIFTKLRYNHDIEDKENAPSSSINHQSTDKKYNDTETEKRKNRVEGCPTVPVALKAEGAPETFTEIQRFLNAHPSYAKNVEKIAKQLRKKNCKPIESEEEKSESESDRRKKECRKSHHKDHNKVVEKITLERKIYKKNNIHDYLSTTIDESLEQFGIFSSCDRNQHFQNNQRHHHRNHLPSVPTIREITSSSSESDEYLEKSKFSNILSPVCNRSGRNNTIEVTTMPD